MKRRFALSTLLMLVLSSLLSGCSPGKIMPPDRNAHRSLGWGHDAFRFDAWRNGMNVAVDYAWFADDKWKIEQSDRLLNFFYNQGIGSTPINSP